MPKQFYYILTVLFLFISSSFSFGQTKYKGKSRGRDISPCYESKDNEVKGDCFYDLGHEYYALEQLNLAADNYNKALSFYPSKLYFKRAQTTEALADALSKQKKEDDAIAEYNNAIKLYEKQNYNQNIVKIYEKLSKIYLARNENEKAKEALRKALELESNRSDNIRLNTKLDIVEIKEKQLDSSINLDLDSNTNQNYPVSSSSFQSNTIIELEEVEEEEEEEVDDIQLLETYGAAEEYYEATGNTSAAIETKKKSRGIAKENQRQDIVGQKSLEIANSYYSTNQTEEAVKELNYAIAIADSTQDYNLKLEAYNLSAKMSEQNDNTNEAISTYKSIIELKDSLYQKKLENIQSSNELLKSQGKAEVYAQQKETIALQREEIKLQKWLLILVIALFVAALIVLYILRKNHRIQKRLNAILELRSLRSQMNPHFVFNALNSINEFIAQSDERMANRYLTSFSKLMRSVMQNVEQDFVPLKQDLDIVNDYLTLEHLRFKDKFDYELIINNDIDLEEYLIPPMMLQPYIENAIWHGLRYKTEKGQLNINIDQNERGIQIKIADNGIGREESQKLKTGNQREHKSTAMKNISNRVNLIKNLYQKDLSITITDLEPGTLVQIDLPKITNE